MRPRTRHSAGSGKMTCRWRSTKASARAESGRRCRTPGTPGATADRPPPAGARPLTPRSRPGRRRPAAVRLADGAAGTRASRLLRALLLEELDALGVRGGQGRLDVAALDRRDDDLADEVAGLRDVGDGERGHARVVD